MRTRWVKWLLVAVLGAATLVIDVGASLDAGGPTVASAQARRHARRHHRRHGKRRHRRRHRR